MSFKNEYISVSRLKTYEQCPLAFRLRYVEGHKGEPTLPLLFGSFVHAVLEDIYRWVVENEYRGPVRKSLIQEVYRAKWEQSGLVGANVYEEGYDIVLAYFAEYPVVDHQTVLGVEQEFHQLGEFEAFGFLDRVDKLDDESIRIVDYKTNRMLFTREEVDSDLQMTMYALAAKHLWPWAKNVELSFDMVRHNVRMTTLRTDEQLERLSDYIGILAKQTETAEHYPAKLSSNCPYCEHRTSCPAYQEALAGKAEVIASTPDDLESVAQEREHVSRLAKVLTARQKELDKIIKTNLDAAGELKLANTRYRLITTGKIEYPIEPTLAVLEDIGCIPAEDAAKEVLAVDKSKVDKLVKRLGRSLDRDRMALLKTHLSAVQTKSCSSRLYAKACSPCDSMNSK